MLGSPLVIAAIVASPLILAAILLRNRPWAPVLDMAMTELRVRDVGTRHTPLIGLPGRIGNFPDQGSHPGPSSFYLLAPFYRLSRRAGLGTRAGQRRDQQRRRRHRSCGSATAGPGCSGALVLGAIAAVAVRGYGLNVLTHPWNPYFPVAALARRAGRRLVGAVAAITGWRVVAVVAASVAAQTHVPYLLNAIAMSVLVLGGDGWRLRQRRPTRGRARAASSSRSASARVLWVPPFVDQLDPRSRATSRMLVEHFASDPPEPAIGVGEGVRVFFRHLDAPSAIVDLFVHGDAFVHRSGLDTARPVLGRWSCSRSGSRPPSSPTGIGTRPLDGAQRRDRRRPR